MQPRTLLALFVLVAGLGGFIWFFERDLPSTDTRVEQGKKLVRLDPESVRGVVLTTGGQVARLERVSPGPDDRADADDEWLLAEPRKSRADALEVRDFLERLESLEKERTLENVPRDQLGLDQPRGEVRIETGSENLVLRFGSEIPASSNTIVEVGSGPPFYVVDGGLVEAISRDPNDWRSRDAVPIERHQIERIEILNPLTGVVLERTEDGFRMVEPIQDSADEDKVSALLAGVVELEIGEFVDEPKAEFSATPSAARLVIADSPEPVLVEVDPIEADGDMVAVRVNGQMFKAETDLASHLRQLPREWQSTRWSGRDAFVVDAFRVVHAAGESRFERREGDWLRGEVEIGYSQASAFLSAVAAAKGVPVDSMPSDSGETPSVEIELESNGNSEVLWLWAQGDGHVGEREGRATLIRLAPESVEDLLSTLADLEAASETVPD